MKDSSNTLIMIVREKLINSKEVSFEAIETSVDETIHQIPGLFENVDKQKVINNLVRMFKESIGRPMNIEDKSNDHKLWLTEERKSDWKFWNRYKISLESKMSASVVDVIDESTNYILNRIGDPKELDSKWDRRGLVVGDVQAGKTANYTGLICKAADAGYKMIIVLAGMNNNLRSQTQVRLDEDFIGRVSDAEKLSAPIGVGAIDSSIMPDFGTTRDDKGDFKSSNIKNGIRPNNVTIFVVKKNKTVLESLISWLSIRLGQLVGEEKKETIISSIPLLVIDDEADNGSVDTGIQDFDSAPDMDYCPKTINRLIRQLLKLFQNSSYVGYTATPFANIFIHHLAETASEGKDLFPSHFVSVLPSSDAYLGANSLFLESGLRNKFILKHVCDSEKWIPEKHDKTYSPKNIGEYGIPSSLEHAICSFLLAVTIRKLRGNGEKHCSMLINVSRFIDVQNKVFKQVETYFKTLKQSITRCIGDDHYISILKDIWSKDLSESIKAYLNEELDSCVNKKQLFTFNEILENLKKVLPDISLKKINGSASDVLDYKDYEKIGLKTIVIGGDKLSRGLTLEGLIVSYFFRTVRSADTLLQMGRWFGYRAGYEDLCRVYLTPSLNEDFINSAQISEDTRQEFFEATERGLTPKQYAFKIHQREIDLTSKAKRRHATEFDLNTYNGSLIQTTLFDKANLESNYKATMALLDSVNDFESVDGIERNGLLIKKDTVTKYLNVPSSVINEFLTNYRTGINSQRVVSSLLKDYVCLKNSKEELTKWTVMIIGNKKENSLDSELVKIRSNFDIGLSSRKHVSQTDSQIAIKALAVSGEEGFDLSEKEWNAALKNSIAYWEKTRKSENMPNSPYGHAIRDVRSKNYANGLLILYFFKNETGSGFPIVSGFAISFPYGNKLNDSKFIANSIYEEEAK